VIEELEKLAEKRGKDGTAARIALQLIKKRDVGILEADERADDALILYGKRGYAVATQDTKLKRKLKKGNVKLIYIRQKKYVKIE
jgi:rRNA-processing protein FCF1